MNLNHLEGNNKKRMLKQRNIHIIPYIKSKIRLEKIVKE